MSHGERETPAAPSLSPASRVAAGLGHPGRDLRPAWEQGTAGIGINLAPVWIAAQEAIHLGGGLWIPLPPTRGKRHQDFGAGGAGQ